jgi:hypothetical protein
VFLWQFFLHSVTVVLGQFLVSFNELGIFVLSQFGTDDERSRHGVENLITLLDEMDRILIVILQRPNKPGLRRQLAMSLQMVHGNLPVRIALRLKVHQATVLLGIDLAVHL